MACKIFRPDPEDANVCLCRDAKSAHQTNQRRVDRDFGPRTLPPDVPLTGTPFCAKPGLGPRPRVPGTIQLF